MRCSRFSGGVDRAVRRQGIQREAELAQRGTLPPEFTLSAVQNTV